MALSTDWRQIQHTDQGHLLFQNVRFDSYTSAILTDFLRQKLIEHQQSFTFETVMSSKDKVDTLKKARDLGFRTYLYYVATEDPLINISRVKYRILTGGHSVPENKIIERYYRSLELLSEAVQHTNRAYIFDNSGSNQTWIAEITEGTDLELKTNSVPEWVFRYLLNKI
jgi:predicted ABC-type ATPase